MHVVHSLGTGGTEAGVRKLLAGLDCNAFEQTVCTVLAGPAVQPQTGTRAISLGRSRAAGILVPEFYRVFSRERPHIVHARNWGTIEAVPAARLAGVRGVIYSEHGLDVRTVNRQPWRRNAFRRLCLRWADRTFAVSNGLRDYFAKQLRISGEHLAVIANGVDTELFQPAPQLRTQMRRRLGVGPETIVVGTVSRLDPVKDHRTLFRAAEMVLSQGCPLHLVVVGNGPERAALERDAHGSPCLRERVVFVGETADVSQWLNSFDVFVLPSLAEGMSNTLLEAMASGVAPVASRVGGNPEVVEEGQSGLLFDAGDPSALASCLKALALDNKRREALATKARQRVCSCFGLKTMLDNYSQLYEDVLARKGVLDSTFARGAVGQSQGVSLKAVEATRKIH